jgi:hypothetical protein
VPALLKYVGFSEMEPSRRPRTAARDFPQAVEYHRNNGKEKTMSDAVVDALVLDLLNWLATGEKIYQEVIDIWRTSCPRLPVWEDANDRGLVAREHRNGREIVSITPAGSAYLRQQKPHGPAASRPPDFIG